MRVAVPETAGAQTGEPLAAGAIQIDLEQDIGIATDIIGLAWIRSAHHVDGIAALEGVFLDALVVKSYTTVLPIDNAVTFGTAILEGVFQVIEALFGDLLS